MKKFSYFMFIGLLVGFSGSAVKDSNYMEKGDVNSAKVITKVSDEEYAQEAIFEWKISKSDRIEIQAFNQSSNANSGQLTQLLSNGGQQLITNRFGDEGILVPADGILN